MSDLREAARALLDVQAEVKAAQRSWVTRFDADPRPSEAALEDAIDEARHRLEGAFEALRQALVEAA